MALVILLVLAGGEAFAIDRHRARFLLGSPIYAMFEPRPDSVPEEERDVDLMEFRPAEENHTLGAGRRYRARFKLSRRIRIAAYALAGFEMKPESIDAKTIYILDQAKRLWQAALPEAKDGFVPKPELSAVPGKFSVLQTEASDEIFAIDELNRLTVLTAAGTSEPAQRLKLNLFSSEIPLRIVGIAKTGLQILTSQNRVIQISVTPTQGPFPKLELIPGYSLLDEDLALPEALSRSFRTNSATLWDVRGNPFQGDFWVLDESTHSIWLKTKADGEGERLWIEYPLTEHLTEAEGGQKIQILGMDSKAIFLKVGPHSMMISRVSESPAGMKVEPLYNSYFTEGMNSRGAFGGLYTTAHILQPWLADRGTDSVRSDMAVRDIRLELPDVEKAEPSDRARRDAMPPPPSPDPFDFDHTIIENGPYRGFGPGTGKCGAEAAKNLHQKYFIFLPDDKGGGVGVPKRVLKNLNDAIDDVMRHLKSDPPPKPTDRAGIPSDCENVLKPPRE